MSLRKGLRYTIRIAILLFVFANVVAAFHAYKFTHFADTNEQKPDVAKMNSVDKIKILLTGTRNPKPKDTEYPNLPFENITLQSNKRIEGWYIPCTNARGTVAMFHGYGGSRSGMLDRAYEFLNMGYNVLLINFMGAGKSEGDQVTIGFKEAAQVTTAYNYLLREKNERNILLFGTSMGAASIMKAIADDKLKPTGIVIECPFGTMYNTVCNRFKMMQVPSFPVAAFLTFWGGVENGFWAFDHNPVDYAKSIDCPVLLLFGEKDDRVGMDETQRIFQNIASKNKVLHTYPNAGHENYLHKYKNEWIKNIQSFLSTLPK